MVIHNGFFTQKHCAFPISVQTGESWLMLPAMYGYVHSEIVPISTGRL